MDSPGPSPRSAEENEHSNIDGSASESPRPARKTIQYLFSKAALAADASTSGDEPELEPPRPPSRSHSLLRQAHPRSPFSTLLRTHSPHSYRYTLHRELSGRLHSWAAARAHAAAAAALTETRFLDVHPWRTPLLGASHSQPPSGCTLVAAFDSSGELLATGGEDGTLLVHSGEALAEASTALSTSNASLQAPPGRLVSRPEAPEADPLLALRTGLPRVSHLRWNPADENVVAVTAGGVSKSVLLYDLQATQGRAKAAVLLPASAAGGAGDVAFFSGGGGYSLLVGGPAGQVFIWDARAAGPPAATLQSTRGGAVVSVALIEGNSLAVAATASGDVKVWDLRGGSGGALRFGGVPNHHPILTAVDLRTALSRVPGLAEQAGRVPVASIHSMSLSPSAPHRAAFHLGCGWSGILDLYSKEITHVHAPPQALVDEQPTAEDGARAMVAWAQMAAPGLRRRAAWSGDGQRYLVPSRLRDALAVLDFADSPHAGCWALGGEDGLDEREAGGSSSGSGSAAMVTEEEPEDERIFAAARNPPAVMVPLSQAAICAAAAPGGNGALTVAAGAHNLMSLVRQL
jgi:hypothetical protein